jgi:hypothetical protein
VDSIIRDSEGNLSSVCQPIFNVCFDLPNLSCIGIFSCDKCDCWRSRVLNHRQDSKSRDKMKFYKCTRQKRRSKGITVRVSFTNSEAIVQHEKKKHPAVDGTVQKSLRNGRKKIIFETGAVHVSEKGINLSSNF